MPRVGEARTGTSHTLLVHELGGNGQTHFGAFADKASDGKTAAQTLCPLLDSGYSVVTRTRRLQGLLTHPAAIIPNPKPQLLLAIAQENMNLPGVGVLKRVGDRLAANLQQIIAGQGVQRTHVR